MATDPRLLMSLLIGTNDIGRMNKTAADTHKSVVAVARALLAGSRGLLLINAILPRAPSPFDYGFGTGTRIDWAARVHETNALLAQSTRSLGSEFGVSPFAPKKISRQSAHHARQGPPQSSGLSSAIQHVPSARAAASRATGNSGSLSFERQHWSDGFARRRGCCNQICFY